MNIEVPFLFFIAFVDLPWLSLTIQFHYELELEAWVLVNLSLTDYNHGCQSLIVLGDSDHWSSIGIRSPFHSVELFHYPFTILSHHHVPSRTLMSCQSASCNYAMHGCHTMKHSQKFTYPSIGMWEVPMLYWLQ